MATNTILNNSVLATKIGVDKHLLRLFKQRQREALREAEAIKKRFFKKPIKVLGVSGSMRHAGDCPQEDSTTEWLLKKCLDEAKKLGAETKLLILRNYDIRPCKGCYSTTNTQCHFKCTCYPPGDEGDDMTNKLYDIIIWADVIIFATPVHSFAMSSLMKLFIDRLISMDGSLAPALPNDAKNKAINIKHTQYIQYTAS
ncbi:MAG: flavodoxin family protein, partial [Candidatus Nanoarchaeia archaeon]